MSFHMSGSPPLLGFYDVLCMCIYNHLYTLLPISSGPCMASHSSAFSAFAVRCTSPTPTLDTLERLRAAARGTPKTFREAAGIRKLRMMEAPNRPPRHMGFRWPAAEKNGISFAGLSLERCRGRETWNLRMWESKEQSTQLGNVGL